MDSVSLYAFEAASTPNIEDLASSIEPAHSFGTFTSASFYAMMSHCGAIPQPLDREFRPYAIGDITNRWIPLRMKGAGYNTFLITSNPLLYNKGQMDYKFDHYHYDMEEGIRTPAMIQWFSEHYVEPFFVVMLCMETHYPFMNRDKRRSTQIKAIEFLDTQVKTIYNLLPEDSRLIITSDHGEIFNGIEHWGHKPFDTRIRNANRLHELLDVFLAIIEKPKDSTLRDISRPQTNFDLFG